MANANILVVEDETIVAKYIQKWLRSLGYVVPAVVSSGEEAVEKAQETRPDLVLMDIVLKGSMDGVEAAKEIRARLNIPIVFLTAYADDNTLERAKITEPFGYILKPFEERELHSTIEMALYKHRMEKQLKESREWFATTLKSIGDAVIATDKEGLITFMNPVAESLTGWEQKEALGRDLKDIFSIVDGKTRVPTESPEADALQRGVAINLADRILISRDGREISIDDSIAPIRDDSGNIAGIVLVFRDVTERKRVAEELLKAQKLESIGILAGGIAHDFNNLLTSILGNVSLSKARVNTEDETYRRLGEAEKACNQAKRLTQQLLTFSKGGAPVKKLTSIERIIRESVSFTLRGSSVRCEFSIEEGLWDVEVDEGQIAQVITNLVINAEQAVPQGGVVKVSAENASNRSNALVHPNYVNLLPLPLREGRYVKITVEDEGERIPQEHLSKIFDPYFITKQRSSGLGLATAYSIIKNHDGYIEVESGQGVGMKVHIYIPASTERVEEKEEGVAEEGVLGGRGRVLIMDDEEMIREVTGEMLSHIGYEVECASDGAEAIELYKRAREENNPFDVVIMDLTVLEGMGGKEAIRRLIEIDPNIRAVVSSGYSDDRVMSEYRNHGFRGVISKPYSIGDLSGVLHEVMNEK
ncbi:MAG: response regulator [Ignavibacteriales bacterium]